MISISDNWRSYFHNHHEGLGTTYERFILHRHFEAMKKQFSICNIVEIPSFGMTGISGINSMWWAKHGVLVTVVDDERERLELTSNVWKDVSLKAEFIYDPLGESKLPFGNKTFDMGWNFASLWFVPDLESFLEEMARITKKVIFICVPNRLGLGYMSRFVIQKNDGGNLHLQNIMPGRIEKILHNLDWKIFDRGFLDIPPWPDIAMKKEDLLLKLGFRQFAKRMQTKEDNYLCILDFFNGEKINMENDIMKYAFLEHSPWIVKRFWAHHEWIVFTPGRDE